MRLLVGSRLMAAAVCVQKARRPADARGLRSSHCYSRDGRVHALHDIVPSAPGCQ